MIRKYLIFGKQLILSSTRFEIPREEGTPAPMEIKLPVEELWKAQEILKKVDLLQSTGEDAHTIKDEYSALLKLLIPYCTSEKDRAWLYEQVK